MSLPVIFRFLIGEISPEKHFFRTFYSTKRFVTIITIKEDFDSLLPARTVTVKRDFFSKTKNLDTKFSKVNVYRAKNL